MLRQFVRAAAIVLFAGTASAQIVPGDSPNRGVGAEVSGSRGIGALSRTRAPKGNWAEYENERNYRETIKRIPDKQSSNDPWKNVRQAPTAGTGTSRNSGDLGIMEVAFTQFPRWLRVAFVAAMVVLAGAFGLYAYRHLTQPVTLTVAVGSYDGDAARIMSAIASELASTKSPVRLKVLDKGSAPEAVKAFSSGQADLAVVRGDIGDLSAARTVALLTHGVVLLVAPPGSAIDSIQALKGKTVGVIARNANQKVIDVLTHEYDLDQAKVQFKDIAPGDILQALKLKQVHALLIVTPISEKYLAMLRDLAAASQQAAARAVADRVPPERSRHCRRLTKAMNCRKERSAAHRPFRTRI